MISCIVAFHKWYFNLGEPTEGTGGSIRGPDYTYSSPIPECKNPKGKPGWGNIEPKTI